MGKTERDAFGSNNGTKRAVRKGTLKNGATYSVARLKQPTGTKSSISIVNKGDNQLTRYKNRYSTGHVSMEQNRHKSGKLPNGDIYQSESHLKADKNMGGKKFTGRAKGVTKTFETTVASKTGASHRKGCSVGAGKRLPKAK